jgi:hypothetical protein
MEAAGAKKDIERALLLLNGCRQGAMENGNGQAQEQSEEFHRHFPGLYLPALFDTIGGKT